MRFLDIARDRFRENDKYERAVGVILRPFLFVREMRHQKNILNQSGEHLYSAIETQCVHLLLNQSQGPLEACKSSY